MTAELIDDKKQWDQFVEKSPQGLLFHKWDFLKTVERHSRYRFLPYGVYSGEELRCIFPFFVGRTHGLTVMYSPPPNTQMWYLGPAFDRGVHTRKAHARETIFQQVTDELSDEIHKIGPNLVSMTTVPNFLDVRSFIWKNYRSDLNLTHTINLEKSLDDIWMSFTKRCRQRIGQLDKHSPEVHQTSDASAMLDLWRARFYEKRLKVPLLSDSYLKELMAAFPQEMTVYSVSIDGRLVTACASCAIKKDEYCLWIGGASARRDLGVNEYLDWEMIKRAKSEGFKKVDLGGGVESISTYKSKFNPVLEPYCELKKAGVLSKVFNVAGRKRASIKLKIRQISC